MDIQDREILNEFVSESREHLADIESDLLAMEKAGDDVDDELINRVFRAIHTVKGASGFFGLQKISRLSHTMENLLAKLRDRELSVTSPRIDALLNAYDLLKGMIDDVDNSDSFEIDDVIKMLESSLEKSSSGKSQNDKVSGPQGIPEGPDIISPLPPEVLEAAKKKGPMNLYHFIMDASSIATAFEKETDGKTLYDVMSQIGEIVYAEPDPSTIVRDRLPYPPKLDIYFSTILEPDVLAITYNINEKTIEPVPAPAAEKKPLSPLEAVKKIPSKEVFPEGETPSLSASETSVSLKSTKKVPQSRQETVRVSLQLLNRLMDLAGELVLGRNQLLQTLKNSNLPILHTLSQRVTELQEHVMQTRMQPVGNVFNRFPRIVRDMSKKVNKKINLKIEGNEVELDRSIIEIISDPLTHLIRNSVDHGIETPEERAKAGKEPEGTIYLRAYQERGQANIEIQDDGRGIDPEKIRAKAIEKGILTQEEATAMNPRELINLVFRPGFSTAEAVSDISGRGVGMDVVKTNFERFGGVIEIDSEVGQGTTVTVRLPLTLAIIPSIITKVEKQRFAIPQVNLEEIVRVKEGDKKIRIERVKGYEVLRLRGHLLSLVRLADVLKIPRTITHPKTGETIQDRRINIADRRTESPAYLDNQNRREGSDRRKHRQEFHILVLKFGGNKYGLIVDEVLDTEEIVVKPLSSYLKSIPLYSGTTIMGDGRIAMILDVQGIARSVNLKLEDIKNISRVEEEGLTRKRMLEKQYILLFTVNENEVFTLPMSMVARIEKITVKDIETIGEKEFVSLRGKSLPLIRLEQYLPIKPPEREYDTLFGIIPRMASHPFGIIATNVIDAIETTVDLDTESIHERGFLGTIILSGKTIPVIDLFALLEMVDPEQQKAINLQETPPAHPARILLVEDTPFFMKLTKSFLESAGHEVLEAQDGAEALKILRREKVDMVISDIEMPVMDGYELIQNIRKEEKLYSIPAMALTALSDDTHRTKGLALGFDAYEAKINKKGVLSRVKELLEKKNKCSPILNSPDTAGG